MNRRVKWSLSKVSTHHHAISCSGKQIFHFKNYFMMEKHSTSSIVQVEGSKQRATLFGSRFIYFSKGSSVILHRSFTNTKCICERWRNNYKERCKVEINLTVNDCSLTCCWWTNSLTNHWDWITNGMIMTSRMSNTDTVRLITCIIWRVTWHKVRTSQPEEATNTSFISIYHMKTAASTIYRASIILTNILTYLTFHLN